MLGSHVLGAAVADREKLQSLLRPALGTYADRKVDDFLFALARIFNLSPDLVRPGEEYKRRKLYAERSKQDDQEE